DVLALDVVDVVEVGTADGDAADVHGPQHGDGRDDAGAAHARHDAQDLADLLARLELDGVRPARVVGGVAQAVAQVEVLQLHDHAVDLVRHVVALLDHLLEVGEDPLDVVGGGVVGVDGQAPVGERPQQLRLRAERGAGQQVVAVEGEGPGGGEAGVELAHAAGGGVVRVGERLLALVHQLGFDVVEDVDGQIDFGAHREQGRDRAHAGHGPQRYGAYGAHVGGDDLALDVVAACDGADEEDVLGKQL